MSFGLPYGVKERGSDGKLHSVNTINGERYVYYDRLKDDTVNSWAPDLHKKARSVFDWRISHGSDAEDICKYFANLSKYEFAKEKSLLETHFKTSYDPNSKECGKALIEAFNEILSTKEIFERNALLIANTNGQKALFSFFPFYLNKVLQAWIDDPQKDFVEDIKQIVAKGVIEGEDESDKIKKAIQQHINENAFELVEKALEYMFSEEVGVESGLASKVGDKKNQELKKAYKEIFSALRNLQEKARNNEFIEGTIKTYKLDKLGEMIVDSLDDDVSLSYENIKSSLSGFKFDVKVGSETGSKSGIFTEYFAKRLGEVVLSSSGTTFTAHHTGDKGEQKVDYMFTVGMSNGAEKLIEKQLDKFKGGRGSNVRDVKELTEKVFEQFGNEKGFMIFVNAKNWSLGKNVKNGTNTSGFRGFSAGEPMDLNKWDDMMHVMDIRGRDFIFTILQMIPHAIGNPEGDYEKIEELSMMFERAIGSALFDDFVPSDPFEDKKGLRIVHLLYLNGIYFPLSVFYSLLSKAFGDFQDSLQRKDLVKVHFKMPKDIKYPEQEDEEPDLKAGKKPWVEQSNEALSTIKISYHFLKGFKKFMEEFYSLDPNI